MTRRISGLAVVVVLGACEAAVPASLEPGSGDAGVEPSADDLTCWEASDEEGAASDRSVSCDPTRRHPEPGPGGWMPTPANSSGVQVDPMGWLTLGSSTRSARAAWVANSSEGTVSKMEIGGNCEVARYPSVRNDATNTARPWNEWCNWANRGNCPSRTAVDQNFDAYVANRAFGTQPTTTKYANDIIDCVDRNGNGRIDTSTDVNGDCRINMGDPREFVGNNDECILWTRNAGPWNGVARALAVGLSDIAAGRFVGDPWVGMYNTDQICRLDSATGVTRECVRTGRGEFYGCATARDGRVWCVRRTGARNTLGYIMPGAPSRWSDVGAVPGSACPVAYGLSFDASGRLFIANSDCDPNLRMYNPATGAWSEWTIPRVSRCQWENRTVWVRRCGWWGCWWEPTTVTVWVCYNRFPVTRGVAADLSSLWIAVSHECDSAWWNCRDSNVIGRYRLSDMSWQGYVYAPVGRGFVGAGISPDPADPMGMRTFTWAVAGSNSVASRYDPATGAWLERAVGAGPYTYSDFIGFGLNAFAEPNGYYGFTTEGCNMGACASAAECVGGTCTGGVCILPSRWNAITYTADIPPGTAISFLLRTADTVAALGAAPWIGPFNASDADTPIDLAAAPGPVPPRRYLEARVVLQTSDPMVRPRFRDLTVVYRCEP